MQDILAVQGPVAPSLIPELNHLLQEGLGEEQGCADYRLDDGTLVSLVVLRVFILRGS